MGIRVRVAGAVAALTAPPAIQAQVPIDVEAERGGVAYRIADEYRPIGGRVGSVFLYPEVDIGVVGTDNVLASPDNKRSDAFARINAALRVLSQSGTNRSSLYGFYGRDIHARFEDEDASSYGLRGLFRLGTPDRSNIELTGTAERRVDDREDINDVAEARSPIRRNRFAGRAAYTMRANRISLTGFGRAFRFDFNDARDRAGATIDQDYRDYTQYGGGLEARYTLPRGWYALARGSIDKLEYDFSVDNAGFDPLTDRDRSSSRIRGEAGVGIEVADTLYGDLTVGYLRRDFVSQPVPIDTSSGFSFNANLVWNANPRTTVRASADRDFLESAQRDIAGYRVTGGSVALDYAPVEWLVLTGEASLADFKPIGPGSGRPRTEYGAAVSARAFLTRRYRLVGQLRRAGRNANDVAFEFDSLRATIGVEARF